MAFPELALQASWGLTNLVSHLPSQGLTRFTANNKLSNEINDMDLN